MAEKKTSQIHLRVTPEEEEKVKEAARIAGMTVSAFILYRLAEITGEVIGDAIIKKRKKGS